MYNIKILVFNLFLIKNLHKMKKYKIFEIENYDNMIKTLCTKKKIICVKSFFERLIKFMKTHIYKDLVLDTSFKTVKILFLSMYIHYNDFDIMIFNNKTEYNKQLKDLSLEINKIFKTLLEGRNTLLVSTKLAITLEKFYKTYKTWEKLDKRINTNNHLINYYKIEINKMRLNNISNLNTRSILEQSYGFDQTKLLENIRYMRDTTEIEYFNTHKNNILMFDKIKDDLYWINISYKIGEEELYKDTIIELLKKAKNMFIDCVPNNLQVQNEIHENIDLTILEQVVTDSVDFEYIYSKILYFLNLLKSFQAPVEDSSWEEWCDEINNKVNNRVKYTELVPYFFKNLYRRVLYILEFKHKLNKLKLKNI
jgi:hypothetical protein